VRTAGTFDKLGINLGALGFLIDMLNYQPTLAKKLFVWDDVHAELRPLMGRAELPRPAVEPASASSAIAHAASPATTAESATPSLELPPLELATASSPVRRLPLRAPRRPSLRRLPARRPQPRTTTVTRNCERSSWKKRARSCRTA
jgi:chemosensory pili system protein ChpA (sensor histidine kinase/response regulator)